MIIFKTIRDHPSYEISIKGDVRRKDTTIFLKPQFNNGHYKVKLDGKTEYISKLVADAFLTKEKDKDYIRHLDNNPLNNDVSNLKWSTKREIQKSYYGLGINAPGGNEKPKKIKIVETGDIFPSIRSCARHVHGAPNGIRRCLKGELKTYKGFTYILID